MHGRIVIAIAAILFATQVRAEGIASRLGVDREPASAPRKGFDRSEPRISPRLDRDLAQGCGPASRGYCGAYLGTHYCCYRPEQPLACINHLRTGRVVCVSEESAGQCSRILRCRF